MSITLRHQPTWHLLPPMGTSLATACCGVITTTLPIGDHVTRERGKATCDGRTPDAWSVPALEQLLDALPPVPAAARDPWPPCEPDCDGEHGPDDDCRPPVDGCHYRGADACREPYDCNRRCQP